jgi:hypothetical protein
MAWLHLDPRIVGSGLTDDDGNEIGLVHNIELISEMNKREMVITIVVHSPDSILEELDKKT